MRRAVISLFCLLLAAPVSGQQSIDELLEQVRSSRDSLSSDTALDDLTTVGLERPVEALLSEARAGLLAATRLSDQLEREEDAGQRELQQMEQALRADTADMSDVFGVVRQYAGDTASTLRNSLVAAEFGGDRTAALQRLGRDGYIPAPDELRGLAALMLQELEQSARVSRFRGSVVDAAGVPGSIDVVRVGLFNLVSGDRFLRYEVSNGTIQELVRQPARRYRSDAETLFNATGSIAPMAVDPTGGQLLGLLIQTPDLRERAKQGGPVGYVIIALGLAGLLIGLYRLSYLAVAGRRISRQLESATPLRTNALGRILGVYYDNKDITTEALELKLDEAIIRETPAMERWQVALKVIAAVAPLLGLLGTVIGMIETFQQITLFGTSDPRLMADGISKALVTTMLGLLVAIPIVLIHSMVASRSKRLIEILEEQSAAIIAAQAEKER